MYVLICPCILDPSLRAKGITRDDDLAAFERAQERCRMFGIDTVPLPCPECRCLEKDRAPHSFTGTLDTPECTRLFDEAEEEVNGIVRARGPPLCIVGVDSSPSCGVNMTYYTEDKQPGRGAFLSRFPDIAALDVYDFARFRIYLAAPLFSEAEQQFNLALARLLKEHFFSVYLPQEVGDTSVTRDKAEHKAIFSRHIEALRETDIVVAVIDGADADSGTSWEMGYAYALDKPVIAIRTDFRRAGHHEHVNLMLEESSEVVAKKEEIIAALGAATISGKLPDR